MSQYLFILFKINELGYVEIPSSYKVVSCDRIRQALMVLSQESTFGFYE